LFLCFFLKKITLLVLKAYKFGFGTRIHTHTEHAGDASSNVKLTFEKLKKTGNYLRLKEPRAFLITTEGLQTPIWHSIP
jgi:hypothetical protein